MTEDGIRQLLDSGSDGNIKILHVDDDPDFGALTVDLLAKEDDTFQVEMATSASEGLEKLADGDYDCIVSDYDMPGQNGIEFLKEVRERYPEFPFILFTGKGSEEIASEAITAGVDDYLQKSFGSGEYTLLANRVRNAVQKYRSEQSAAHTRRFFSKLIEHSTDVIPVIGADGSIRYVSPSSEWNLGYEPEDVIGENAFDYIHPEDVEQAMEKFQEAMENPDHMPEIGFRFKHADGSWVRLHGRAKDLLNDPDVQGIVSYNRIVED